MPLNRRVVVAELPAARLATEHFCIVEDEAPHPDPGEVLVRTRLLSIDAANRAWMQGLTYRSALKAGTTMAGLAVSEVVESRDPRFAPGELVFGDTGWQLYAAVPAAAVERVEAVEPLTHLLSLYGTSAQTAYHGLTRVGGLKAGDTLLVSAAAGSVGIVAAQVGRLLGARVVGIAGGADKCRWLVEEVGLDAALDYRRGELKQQLRDALSGGADVFFDNVGGDVLDAAMFAMNPRGRIACCGAVSAYDGAKPAAGPRGVPGLLVTRRLRMEGFLLDDFAAHRDEALAALRAWAVAGELRAFEDVADGLDAAPGALIRQLAGGNRGKAMVRVG